MKNDKIKHPKKRFLFQKKLPPETLDVLKNARKSVPQELTQDYEKNISKFDAYIQTDKGYLIKTFPVKIKGRTYHIPEPDPSLIYFSNAYSNFIKIASERKQFLDNTTKLGRMEVTDSLFNFYTYSSTFVIMLYTSLESFVNHQIPSDLKYTVSNKQRTEIYNCEQIQRYLDFKTKYVNIMNEIFKKDFSKDYPIKWGQIGLLKEFRDSIVHTKKNIDGGNLYDYLFKLSLNFNYEKTIYAVRDYMNYYVPEHIENCDCGNDW